MRSAKTIQNWPSSSQNQHRATQAQHRLLDKFVAASRKIRRGAIIHRIKQVHNMTQKEARECFEQCIIFLWLSSIKPDDYITRPPEKIDWAWHEFLMFTAEYREFCRLIGRFIDHHPTTPWNKRRMNRAPLWMWTAKGVRNFSERTALLAKYWPEPTNYRDSNCSDCFPGSQCD